MNEPSLLDVPVPTGNDARVSEGLFERLSYTWFQDKPDDFIPTARDVLRLNFADGIRALEAVAGPVANPYLASCLRMTMLELYGNSRNLKKLLPEPVWPMLKSIGTMTADELLSAASQLNGMHQEWRVVKRNPLEDAIHDAGPGPRREDATIREVAEAKLAYDQAELKLVYRQLNLLHGLADMLDNVGRLETMTHDEGWSYLDKFQNGVIYFGQGWQNIPSEPTSNQRQRLWKQFMERFERIYVNAPLGFSH